MFPLSSPAYKSVASVLAEQTEQAVNKVGPHGYSHGWIKQGENGGPHTHETGPLPDTLQTGAFNYKKLPNGNYSKHSAGTGTRIVADEGRAEKGEYAPEDVARISRYSHTNGIHPSPVIPIKDVTAPFDRYEATSNYRKVAP